MGALTSQPIDLEEVKTQVSKHFLKRDMPRWGRARGGRAAWGRVPSAARLCQRSREACLCPQPGGGACCRRPCWRRGACCLSMRAYQPGAATSVKVPGQSGQSKLHTVGEHRPGGPATAEPVDSDVRRAASSTALQPGPEQHGSGPAAEPVLGRTSSPCAQPAQEARRGLGWRC